MKRTAGFMGTPGALLAVVCDHAPGLLVVIDRKADTWERAHDGEHRYAIMHEPSRSFITTTSAAKAREEVARVSALPRRELYEVIKKWRSAATLDTVVGA